MSENEFEKYTQPEGDLMVRYKYYGSLGFPAMPTANLRGITHFELYYSNPSQFNDPFDCLPILNNKDPVKARRMMENVLGTEPNAMDLVLKRRPDLKGCSDSEIKDALVIEMVEHTGSEDYNRALYDQFKVLCLTRDPISMLMWSHYGNSHKGFALELTLDPDLPPEKNLFPARVQYESDRLDADSVKLENDVLHYKNPVWSYEKEDRVVLSGHGSSEAFNPNLLTAVIFGARVDDEIREAVTDAVENTNNIHGIKIEIYNVQMSDVTYDLSIPGHPYFEHARSSELY